MDDKIGLLEGMNEGSIEAFNQFYDTYAPFVFKLALSLTKNKSEAEDLCHDVFLEVYRKPRQFNSKRGSIKAWLAVKTRSRFMDIVRKRSRIILDSSDGVFEKVINPVKSSEENVMSNLERESIMAAIHKLPENQQAALIQKYYHYKTQKEIASDMEKPIGTIKSFLRYGLSNLKKQLIQVDWAGGDGRSGKLPSK